MDSIWTQDSPLPERPSLSGDLEADVTVIGGGMAGLLTAFFLQQRDVNVVVLEASRIGSGQTKHTTAKITSQHNLIYAQLIEHFGKEKATQYAQANQRAIDEYRRIISQHKIHCDFKIQPAYLYTEKQADLLQKEADAALLLGLPAEFIPRPGFPASGALRFRDQAQFHPLHFLEAISKNLTIYEQTPVYDIEDNKVLTAYGSVRSNKIIFATHFPFLNHPGYYFMRMHQERSYVIALENAPIPEGMFLGIDPGGLSLRRSKNITLLGGGSHRTGENSAGGKYDQLRKTAARLWPDSREIAHWSAQDCMTMDGVPYIGQFSASTPDWYVATGFGKWGMSTSMVAAMVLCDEILGIKSPYTPVFSPQRFKPSASAKNLFKDTMQSTKGLSRNLRVPEGTLEELPAGHGGIVDTDEGKAGVYKDAEGNVFVISAHCPHLGCQLEWNPDEKSWDCPCHGSRFDYRGHLIDNPATKSASENR